MSANVARAVQLENFREESKRGRQPNYFFRKRPAAGPNETLVIWVDPDALINPAMSEWQQVDASPPDDCSVPICKWYDDNGRKIVVMQLGTKADHRILRDVPVTGD